VAALSGWVALYVATALRWEMPAWTWLAYALPSTLCFMAYASDKAAAVQAGRRTPERVLLCLGLVGGWPGALLAQEVLHHKSRKATFRRMFWLSVGLNLLAFMVLFTPLLDPWTPLYAPP
jgi:uncharacterized membrane protein YsdA (DUF1294 family)